MKLNTINYCVKFVSLITELKRKIKICRLIYGNISRVYGESCPNRCFRKAALLNALFLDKLFQIIAFLGAHILKKKQSA